MFVAVGRDDLVRDGLKRYDFDPANGKRSHTSRIKNKSDCCCCSFGVCFGATGTLACPTLSERAPRVVTTKKEGMTMAKL